MTFTSARRLLHCLLVGSRGDRPRPYVPQRLTLWDAVAQEHTLAQIDEHGVIEPADFVAALESVFRGHGHLVVRTQLFQATRWPRRPLVRWPDRVELFQIGDGYARRLSQRELQAVLGKPQERTAFQEATA